jgi:hypothetical protein
MPSGINEAVWLSSLYVAAHHRRHDPRRLSLPAIFLLNDRARSRTRLPALVADVEDHLDLNGPWQYKLSDLYYEPAITAAVEKLAAEEHATGAA